MTSVVMFDANPESTVANLRLCGLSERATVINVQLPTVCDGVVALMPSDSDAPAVTAAIIPPECGTIFDLDSAFLVSDVGLTNLVNYLRATFQCPLLTIYTHLGNLMSVYKRRDFTLKLHSSQKIGADIYRVVFDLR